MHVHAATRDHLTAADLLVSLGVSKRSLNYLRENRGNKNNQWVDIRVWDVGQVTDLRILFFWFN